jgi:hypothetical protein
MTPPTREPEVIAEARRTGTLSVGAILAEYDRVCAERDAAVLEREDVSSQLWDCMNERDGYRARLAACEKLAAEMEKFSDQIVASMDIAVNQNRLDTAGLMEMAATAQRIKTLRAAVAAETQTTPHAGGTDA